MIGKKEKFLFFIINVALLTFYYVVLIPSLLFYDYDFPISIYKNFFLLNILATLSLFAFLLLSLIYSKEGLGLLLGIIGTALFIKGLVSFAPPEEITSFPLPSKEFIEVLKESREVIYQNNIYGNVKIILSEIESSIGRLTIPRYVYIPELNATIPLEETIALYPKGREPNKSFISEIKQGKAVFCPMGYGYKKVKFDVKNATLREGIYFYKADTLIKERDIYALKGRKVLMDFKNCWVEIREIPKENAWGYNCAGNIIMKDIKEAIVLNFNFEKKAAILYKDNLYFKNQCSILYDP